ncbi:MAG: hypothetical protein R3E02_03870 [Blastomonas sp.]
MKRRTFFPVRPAPNSFRRSLPQHILQVPGEAAPAVQGKGEDVRLFFLSFTAFFVAISAFIW